VGQNSGTGAWAPTGVVTGSESWKDYRLSLRFKVQETGGDHRDGAWIGFRYVSVDTCYTLSFQGGLLLQKTIDGRSGGDTAQLAKAPWTNDGDWHEAEITAQGGHIVVRVDGRQVFDVVDDDFLGVGPIAAGGVCLSARKWEGSPRDTVVMFDDVKVEML